MVFVFITIKRSFYEITSRKAILAKWLVKSFHTSSSSCCNLVAQPVGGGNLILCNGETASAPVSGGKGQERG